jgi:two-component system copper resistance phosphate regulon response regulator CusR
LCKPFAFVELLARIRALSRRQSPSSSTLLSYEKICVDLATQFAARNGERLDLTVKEQALLIYFLRHPDQVLSRSAIYEHVWNQHYDGTSNTLEVHIMDLRRKLESHGPRIIFTMRGRGYMLSEKTEAEWRDNT